MIERMLHHFSSRITSDVFTPFAESGKATPSSKLRKELFGDTSLRTAVEKFEPDIIYSDNALFAAHLKVQYLLARQRMPLVAHLRGDWWREFWVWFSQAEWPSHLVGAQHYAYQWFGLLAARKITPICSWLDNVVKHYIAHKKTEVVYQGVDPEEFFEEPPLDFKRPAVAIIQNHTIYPKVLGLLNFKHVVERMPDVNFYITEGEHFAPGYLSLVKESYSSLKNVHFVGGIEGPGGVRRVLSSTDCYVLASGLDCCPTTILEASLMRKPVVASKVGGVPEIVLEGETGWTVKNDAYDQWVDRIRLVVEDTGVRNKIGNKGREWVTRKFGWSTIAKQVEELLISEATT
jgi:glycosyltransferase involved in cell wall biosynthesis